MMQNVCDRDKLVWYSKKSSAVTRDSFFLSARYSKSRYRLRNLCRLSALDMYRILPAGQQLRPLTDASPCTDGRLYGLIAFIRYQKLMFPRYREKLEPTTTDQKTKKRHNPMPNRPVEPHTPISRPQFEDDLPKREK
jgi:hypothetical protein